MIYNRSDWTKVLPKNATEDTEDEYDGLPNFNSLELQGIVWHYIGNGKFNHYTPEQVRSTLKRFQLIDMETKGYSDIMYNMCVAPNGDIYPLRGLINKGAANGTSLTNSLWLSVLQFMGADDPLSNERIVGMQQCKQIITARWPKATQVRGHREMRATSCPGLETMTYIHSPNYEIPVSNPTQTIKVPMPPLNLGDRNNKVLELQGIMAFWGWYKASQDGSYGPITKWAVAEMQKVLTKDCVYSGMVNGIYDELTASALKQWLENMPK